MNDLNEILIKHIEKSNKFQDDAIKKLSSIETHQAYTREELKKQGDVCEDYKKHKGFIYGIIACLSGVLSFLGWLIKGH